MRIETVKLDFKDKAQAKVGSLDNAHHTPGGGHVMVSVRSMLPFHDSKENKFLRDCLTSQVRSKPFSLLFECNFLYKAWCADLSDHPYV